ncbi:MAG: hypothetical protein NXI16_02205 [Alphaproteobacteria bacterium]|nr:hypothetical protein [Alphaproteobacteria bacterium]
MHHVIFLSILGFMALPVVSAAAETLSLLKIERDECARAVRYQPSGDVAYQPGVDVRGRAVAPADLGGGVQFELPEVLEIPITVDLAERFGLPEGTGLLRGDSLTVGKITVNRRGEFRLNGELLGDAEQAALTAACRERLNASE